MSPKPWSVSRWHRAIIWALVLFFLAGGTGNLFPPTQVSADYARWGYPGRFHYSTGALEWVSAILIARPASRGIGLLLGGSVMLAALATLILNYEFGHATMPLLALIALSLCALWDGRERSKPL